jgi:glycosyltransferase involved in cell wall biosynthesis
MTKSYSTNSDDKGIRLVCLVANLGSALVELRLRLPLGRWAVRNGGCVRIVSIYEYTPADLGWGDIFVFQRDSNQYVLALIKFLRSHGKKVVFEIDDLLTELPPFLSHHVALIANKFYLVESLQQADVVTVTTPRLGKALSVYNQNIRCVPNCSESLPNECARHHAVPSHAVSLIVASSDKVLVDFLVPALTLAQEKLSVNIVAIGPIGDYFSKKGLNVIKTRIMPYAVFKSYVASIDNGIGIIPLDESLFSSCKSPIKYFDYTVAGIPSICSNVPPYSDHIVNGKNGILVENTTDSLYSAIESLVLSHSMRSRITESAIAYVHNNYGWDTAVNAWNMVISMLDPHIPLNRGETQYLYFKNRMNIKINVNKLYWIAKSIVSPASYLIVCKIFKSYGIRGLINRIRRS